MLEKVKLIIEDKIGVDLSEMADDANLRDDLGIDSLDIIEIAMELEIVYKVKVDDERIKESITITDIVTYMTELTKEI